MARDQRDEERRRLAAQVKGWSVEAFHDRLQQAGAHRAFLIYDNGEFTMSHPQLLAPLRAFCELSRDFAAHEGLFIGREDGIPTVFFACVHDTRRGLSQGGLRLRRYEHLAEVVTDSLRLAHGMTRKNALAGLWWGGGKGVIPLTRALDVPALRVEGSAERTALFHAYGRFVASLGGIYYTAEDVGTKTSDMNAILARNRFITCIGSEFGGSGNPSPYTARGVLLAMQAAWKMVSGSPSLTGIRVAVQGIGNVGGSLVELLVAEGARIVATDVDEVALADLTRRLPQVEIVAADEIFDVEAEVFAPCAIGAQINVRTIPRLKVKLVCGAANNILAEPADNARLEARGITYVPDFISNRMGIVNCADEPFGYLAGEVELATERVFADTLRVLRHARETGITSSESARNLADLAAAELHPIIGHRGRLLSDRLVASSWHGRARSETPMVPPSFVIGRDEPVLNRQWEADGRYHGKGWSLAAAPLPITGVADLSDVLSALLLDVEARILENTKNIQPRRILGSGPGSRDFLLAVERLLPDEPAALGRDLFLDHCREASRRHQAATREVLRGLGAGFDAATWSAASDGGVGALADPVVHALGQAGRLIVDQPPGRLYADLRIAARRLELAISDGQVRVVGAVPRRWRRRQARLQEPERWRLSAPGWWGPRLPVELLSQPDDGTAIDSVCAASFIRALWSLAAMGWPDELEQVDEVMVSAVDLERWLLPSQLLAFELTGVPAFRTIHVHGSLQIVERRLIERPQASPGDLDEERFLWRSGRRPLRAPYGRGLEAQTALRRFGPDALRLALLMSLGAGRRATATLTQAHLRRAHRVLQRLIAAMTALMAETQTAAAMAATTADSSAIRRRIEEAADCGRRALAAGRYGEAAQGLATACEDLAGWAESARADPSARLAAAGMLKRLEEVFGPLCPYVLESLCQRTAAGAPYVLADNAIFTSDESPTGRGYSSWH